MEPLDISKEFFGHLKKKGIRYCHWKSNEHILYGLSGHTDLDLLIHKDYRESFNKAIEKFRFKRILSPPQKSNPDIEDYLGFDYETGKLIHLHVHYKLILGKKYIKNYHLPIEWLVFDDIRSIAGVYIPCPELEFLLLIIRANLKLDTKTILRSIISRYSLPYPQNIINEFIFLLEDFKKENFLAILKKSRLPISKKKLLSYIDIVRSKKISLFHLLALRKHIFQALSSYRISTGLPYFRRYLYSRIELILKKLKLMNLKKKTIYKKGRFFALVGADGSGKTTLVNDLSKWLSFKLSVKSPYFGIPKTTAVYLVGRSEGLFQRISKINLGRPYKKVISFLKKQIGGNRWIYIAKKRLKTFEESRSFAEKGGVVIADRYPLPAFHNMEFPMDGPRIKEEGNDILKKKELGYYSKIGMPDMVFVLRTDLLELKKRKSNLEPKIYEKKVEAVNILTDSEKISVIDGNRPYELVLMDIKRKIWELL